MELHPQGTILDLAQRAACRSGASHAMSASLARAAVSASAAGRHEVGLAHLGDHLASLAEGRIVGAAVPQVESPTPVIFKVDAKDGIAQLGFDLVFEDLVQRAATLGVAFLLQRNCYPAAELGYFVRRLAEVGLVGLAAGNAHAMLAVAPGGGPVFSTNPIAFAAPLNGLSPLVIDQATSATAFVNIVRAVDQGTPLPEGWALDADRNPTTDPHAALDGALLPFGGYKGANIAFMVEVLSAGLGGGNWSLDTGHFLNGSAPPGAGMVVLAISPALCAEGFATRLTEQVGRLSELGVHVPGQRMRTDGLVPVEPAVLAMLRNAAG